MEALPQTAVARPYCGSIHLAPALQKSSVLFRWGHQSRHSRMSPSEPAPITQLPHFFYGPSLNGLIAASLLWGTETQHWLNSDKVMPESSVLQSLANASSRFPWMGALGYCAPFQPEKPLLCLKCNMIQRSEVSNKLTPLLQGQSLSGHSFN